MNEAHEHIGPRVEPRLHRSIEVRIPGRMIGERFEARPPNTNDANRQTQGQKWRIRREWREHAGGFAIEARDDWMRRHGEVWEPLKVAVADVVFVLPDARRRDLDNLISSLKPLLDGAVDAKLVVDDSIACLNELSVSFWIRRGSAGETILTFSEPVE